MLKINRLLFLALLSALVTASCTDLEEDLNGDLTLAQAQEIQEVGALLNGAYRNLDVFQTQDRIWAMMEHSGDAVMGPTRGTDWDDNGIWRQLHTQTWDATHPMVVNTFNELLEGVFNASNVLLFNPDAQQAAEARYLRAFYMFYVNDLYGQVPFRDNLENLLDAPVVLSEREANNFVISEIEAIIDDLPDAAPAYQASKNAARALLAKAYLNRGVYGNRSNPSFDAADMDKVIQYADAITGYSLANPYFENFIPGNENSPELIFTARNIQGTRAGNVRSRWMMTLHYNQNPSGWNGFATLADFYNQFEDNDTRRSFPAADLGIGIEDNSGINAGFLVGQQFDKDGNALSDRKGNPLAFTPEVALFETGDNLEITGIRGIKYLPDFANNAAELPDNDYVLLRYADVMLMKAEALLRKGDAEGARTLVNDLRAARGATALATIDENELLAERGRELWWEGHRRQDLIRFGKFLDAWAEKPATDATRLLFPIPEIALSANPNLKQNPGY